jgi:Domain of unknown function (DUF4832)/Domain of unknown function (DUF4874)
MKNFLRNKLYNLVILSLILGISLSGFNYVSSIVPIKSFASSISYQESFEDFPNPERGRLFVYQPYAVGGNGIPNNTIPFSDPGVKSYFRSQMSALSSTIIRPVYVIGDWRDGIIPQSFLDRLTSDFNTIRELGIKSAPEFVYTFPGDPVDANINTDAPKDKIIADLERLKPILQQNEDVIVFMYAGFIGPWGEWGGTTNDNIGQWQVVNDNTRAITNKILEVLPQDRFALVRTTSIKHGLFNDSTPILQQEAFTKTNKSRVGFHNDCYMADYHPDVRTLRLADRPYLDKEGLYVPQSEILDTNCFDYGTPQWSAVPCSDLLEEMTLDHPDVISDLNPVRIVGDCIPEANRRVGYRFNMIDSEVPTSVTAGSNTQISVNMANKGFGNLFNPRDLEIVIRNKNTGQELKLPIIKNQDTRLFMPSPGQTKQLPLDLNIPANTAPGDYDVFLNLPDPMPSIKNRPEYSIQLANVGTWEATTGYNKLNQSVTVQAANTTSSSATTSSSTTTVSSNPSSSATTSSLTQPTTITTINIGVSSCNGGSAILGNLTPITCTFPLTGDVNNQYVLPVANLYAGFYYSGSDSNNFTNWSKGHSVPCSITGSSLICSGIIPLVHFAVSTTSDTGVHDIGIFQQGAATLVGAKGTFTILPAAGTVSSSSSSSSLFSSSSSSQLTTTSSSSSLNTSLSSSSSSSSSISSNTTTTPATLNLKVLLAGSYDSSINLMSTTLRSNNLIPAAQPYNLAPFNYSGTETTVPASLPNNAVDWVLVEIKNSTGTTTQQKAGILLNDGTVIDSTAGATTLTLPNVSTTGNYKVIVRHRNHLAIATNNNVTLTANSTSTVDLTTNTNVKASNQLPIGTTGKYGMRLANVDGDDRINATDKTIIGNVQDAANIYSSRDVNLDGIINATDKTLVVNAQDAIENL